MKTESKMWAKLRPVFLAAKLDPVRVENPICPGTPDVNLCNGTWVELKCIECWPVRASTNVRIPHFSPQQRVWLYRRWLAAPGSTLLILEVVSDKQWLVFRGDVAAKMVGRKPAADHRKSASAILGEHELGSLPAVLFEVVGRCREGRPAT
jgi:hypothetical protein